MHFSIHPDHAVCVCLLADMILCANREMLFFFLRLLFLLICAHIAHNQLATGSQRKKWAKNMEYIDDDDDDCSNFRHWHLNAPAVCVFPIVSLHKAKGVDFFFVPPSPSSSIFCFFFSFKLLMAWGVRFRWCNFTLGNCWRRQRTHVGCL